MRTEQGCPIRLSMGIRQQEIENSSFQSPSCNKQKSSKSQRYMFLNQKQYFPKKEYNLPMQNDQHDHNEQTLSQNPHIHYDYDDDDDNLTPQPKTYDSPYEEKPLNELENFIMDKIHLSQNEPDLISKQLQLKLDQLLEQIALSNLNSEQVLKMRMHELALSKILVNTHSKTEFYLVKAHHHLGEAYLHYKCYEQALDHLTMSLKKNAKINDLNEIKLYHSYVLTTYSRCYFEIGSFEDALEILKKALDIQLSSETDFHRTDNLETLRLISSCYLKLKNYPQALEFIQKVLSAVQAKNGKKSKDYSITSVEKAKILISQGNSHTEAVETLLQAIKTLEDIKYDHIIEIADYYELLSEFYEKSSDHKKQIEVLYKKLQIYEQKYEEGHEKTLKVKKNIAILLQKHNQIAQATRELQEILEYEEKIYPENRAQIGKTLKALGACYLVTEGKLNQAEQCLKKAQKLLSEHGVGKSMKEIKSKLQEIKELKDQKQSQKEQFRIMERQIQQQPIQMAH